MNKLIKLDRFRIEKNREKICKCKNRKFVIDTVNKIIECAECGTIIDPYDALYDLAQYDEKRNAQLQSFLSQKKELAKYKPRTATIRELERQYSDRNLVPCCPRCGELFDLNELKNWSNKAFLKKWGGK